MRKQDQDEPEGQDPTEEVSAEECAPGAHQCEIKSGDLEEGADASHPSFMEEIQDAYSPEPGLMVPSAEDGLPVPADETNEPQVAPPFTIDNVVCVEDDREWVPIRTEYLEDGSIKEPQRFKPSDVVTLFDRPHVLLDKSNVESRIHVRPIRARCVYYMRQVLSNDAVPDPDELGHKIVFRNCTARRSIGGAFMSLRDEAVYACDYRDPPDPASTEKHLDGPDRERLRSEAYKKKLPLFRGG